MLSIYNLPALLYRIPSPRGSTSIVSSDRIFSRHLPALPFGICPSFRQSRIYGCWADEERGCLSRSKIWPGLHLASPSRSTGVFSSCTTQPRLIFLPLRSSGRFICYLRYRYERRSLPGQKATDHFGGGGACLIFERFRGRDTAVAAWFGRSPRLGLLSADILSQL